jgi:hypothetical protein
MPLHCQPKNFCNRILWRSIIRMSEIRTVTTLCSKYDEMNHSIRPYERQREQACADLDISQPPGFLKLAATPGRCRAIYKCAPAVRTRSRPIMVGKEMLIKGPLTTREPPVSERVFSSSRSRDQNTFGPTSKRVDHVGHVRRSSSY